MVDRLRRVRVRIHQLLLLFLKTQFFRVACHQLPLERHLAKVAQTTLSKVLSPASESEGRKPPTLDSVSRKQTLPSTTTPAYHIPITSSDVFLQDAKSVWPFLVGPCRSTTSSHFIITLQLRRNKRGSFGKRVFCTDSPLVRGKTWRIWLRDSRDPVSERYSQ